MHKNNSVYREMHKSHTRQENRPLSFFGLHEASGRSNCVKFNNYSSILAESITNRHKNARNKYSM